MRCECCDLNGEEVLKYEMFIGDTFKRQIKIKNSQGETLGTETIEKVEFILMDFDNTVKVEEELDFEDGVWSIVLDTDDWEEGTYQGRYKATFVDSSKTTIKQLFITMKE